MKGRVDEPGGEIGRGEGNGEGRQKQRQTLTRRKEERVKTAAVDSQLWSELVPCACGRN